MKRKSKQKRWLKPEYKLVGFCGECLKPIEAIQPGGKATRHHDGTELCKSKVFVTADYENIEVRVIAALEKDVNLRERFMNGKGTD